MWPCSTKPVISRWGIFVGIANNTLYWAKLYISYCKYIKTYFLIINMHRKGLNLDIFKGYFLNILICFAPSDQIVVSWPNIVLS